MWIALPIEMSDIEYRKLLLEAGRMIDQQIVPKDLLFICKRRVSSGFEDSTGASALSLFEEMEERNNLGIDRLEALKDLLKCIKDWSLLQKVNMFEMKRTHYNDLLELIGRALDESDQLEELIKAVCRRKRSVECDVNMEDVWTLLKELENRDYLEFGRLDFLKEILMDIGRRDLVTKVQDFEKQRNNEDEYERKGKDKSVTLRCTLNVRGGGVNDHSVCFQVTMGEFTSSPKNKIKATAVYLF